MLNPDALRQAPAPTFSQQASTWGKGLHFRAIAHVYSLLLGVHEYMSRLEGEKELPNEEKEYNRNDRVEMARNLESKILDSSPIIYFWEKVKNVL